MFSLDYFTSTILWIVGFVFLTYPVYVLLKGSHQGCLPPGPTPLPLIGNLHQIPKQGQWLKFTEWGKEYGPIMYLNMGGQPFIVLSSHEAALDLLSRRSSQYSDRPRLVMCGEIITKGMHILIRPYDAAYRLHQRMEAPLLNIQAARCYRPLQDLESRQLLFDALKESDSAGEQGVNIHHHIERAMASFVYCLEYGYRLQTGYEQQVQDANQVLEAFTQNAMPGVNIVDTFPILNHLPSFLAPWKAKGEKIFGLERNLHVGNMHKGLKNPGWNFAKHYVHSCPEAKGMPEVEIAFDLGILADAALDTSSAALKWLFVAWVTCGEKWVAKAQQIIDDTVGRDRLPQFEDREALSYIDAIVNEILRWRPVVVGGVAHVTKTEDMYLGYRIPAGSIVLGNHFAITRDETVFGDKTQDFWPERWLAEDGSLKDLPGVGFGYGRRICTGRHIALNSIFIQVARILWAFNIQVGVSKETGKRAVIDDIDGTEGLVFAPKAFGVVMEPRGPWVRDLIKTQCYTHSIDHSQLLNKAGEDRMLKKT